MMPNFCQNLFFFICSAEAVTLNDCLQLSYLPSKRNHMLLLYPREILILDLELSQTVGVVAIERSGVPFTQVKWQHSWACAEAQGEACWNQVIWKLICLLF